MPKTYEPIATQTLGSAAATVTFSSIPSTYTYLVLVMDYSITSANDSVYMRLNADSGSNYSNTTLSGNGSSAISGRDTSSSQGIRLSAFNTAQGASTRQVNITQFQNYANSTNNKAVLNRYSSVGGTETVVGLWRNTSAITSILLRFFSTPNFEAGSTFTLYGIKAA